MSILDYKSVLCTGGTGSFGKAFIKRVLETTEATRVVCFSRDELKQSEMQQMPEYQDSRIRFMIGDIRDKDRLYRAFDGIDYVVHAAALKHVPAGQYNPAEFVKSNILGSMNIIDAAIDRSVSKVIALSSDKACAPLNHYGATKLCMEHLMMAANSYSGKHKTRFAVTRYGNVINSRGSVIPLWKQQAASGVLTLTNTEMSRFWMSLDEAVRFVIDGLERMVGEELFIPKLPSVMMTDVARAIAPKAHLEIIGTRPGEKIFESLIGPDELSEDCGDYSVVGRGEARGAYTSSNNEDWLSVEEMRERLAT